ncbi:winged helix-turn-helix transcriptional regulator [Streptomyces pinistramenti]|uniref:winged helix-turn-helix transcriptional regulator n=1 Tax=Streptomyces pinistramenti TaxID=2884812 RepID=UPI001D06CD61|nr:winged helix-turn-helix transcriptional regulator [Streptomyces pinistramenti]MCB5905878.1 winged helix-turn-helix transcriptional regulator [Streptomyces pinistramenti]
MATTGLSPAADADLARTAESLNMLAPRWSVWVLMTLSAGTMRYGEIKPRLPWLLDGQLSPRLGTLTEAGLVRRTEYNRRHVTYGLTDRGTEALPVLKTIAAWGDTYLDEYLVRNKATGKLEPAKPAPAQNIEGALALLTPRNALTILWILRERGTSSAQSLARVALPGANGADVYPRLRQLVDDGLVDRAGTAEDVPLYQLSASGQALAPVLRSVSAWAAGRPSAEADDHPVWGPDPAPSLSAPGTWLTHQPRTSAPPPAPAAWKGSDLFSHPIPSRPLTATPAGGQRR